MVMWQTSLDPFISTIPTQSSSLAAILLKLPGYCISVHIAIYLPTAGQDVQFVSALASLDSCIEDLVKMYPGVQVFLRGDSNVNPKNTSRVSLFQHFLSK